MPSIYCFSIPAGSCITDSLSHTTNKLAPAKRIFWVYFQRGSVGRQGGGLVASRDSGEGIDLCESGPQSDLQMLPKILVSSVWWNHLINDQVLVPLIPSRRSKRNLVNCHKWNSFHLCCCWCQWCWSCYGIARPQRLKLPDSVWQHILLAYFGFDTAAWSETKVSFTFSQNFNATVSVCVALLVTETTFKTRSKGLFSCVLWYQHFNIKIIF